jgi:protein gp37
MSTGIPYLNETWSPITGCSGKGCKAHCWAREMVRRFPDIHGTENEWEWLDPCPIPFTKPQFHADRLDKPTHWKRPRRVGVCFMGDWMDDQVQCGWIDRILDMICFNARHQFFTLTKQPQNLEKKIYSHCPESPARELGGGDYLPNLWNGVSITDQEDADRMIPDLLKVPGKRWVSYEPMLGPVDFSDYLPIETIGGVELENWPSWIVLGCESGPKRRSCDPQWMLDVVRQCKAAGVPVYVKQVDMGKRVRHNPQEWPEELRVRELP